MDIPITERSNPITKNIDVATPEEIVTLLSKCDAEIFDGWQDYQGLFHTKTLSTIQKLSKIATSVIQNAKTSCIVLSGCGTSGRLAFLTARTFNAKLSGAPVLKYLVAGGDKALFTSQEAPEDDPFCGIQMLKEACAGKKKVLFIGITCGLSAPFVAGQLHYCMQNPDIFIPVLLGFNPVQLARNVKIDNWDKTFIQVAKQLEEFGKQGKGYILNPIVGPEPITGSSRMKSGTTTKILLESIFTAAVNNVQPLTGKWCVKDYMETYKFILGDVRRNCKNIAPIVKMAGDCLNGSGSIYYVGCDSLGIVGMIDASECPPTYGATLDDVRGFIDGGYSSLRNIEGGLSSLGEHFYISISDFEINILPHLQSVDLVVILSKDGAIPVSNKIWKSPCKKCLIAFGEKIIQSFDVTDAFDIILEVPISRKQILATIGESALEEWYQLYIELAAKLILNSVSTGAHIIKGKVYENIMVDVKVSNNKLFHRAIGIIQKFSGVSMEEAKLYLLKSIYDNDDMTMKDSDVSISESIQIATLKEKVVPSALISAISKCTISEAVKLLQKQPVIKTALVNALKDKQE